MEKMNVQRSCVPLKVSWVNTAYKQIPGAEAPAIQPPYDMLGTMERFVYHWSGPEHVVKGMVFLGRHAHR
jgi:hypothetical protein